MNEQHGTTCCNCGGQLDLGQGYMGIEEKEYGIGQGIKAVARPILSNSAWPWDFGSSLTH